MDFCRLSDCSLMCVHRVCPWLENSRETENTLFWLINESTKSLLPGSQMLANRSLQALSEKAGEYKLSIHLALDKTHGQNFFFSSPLCKETFCNNLQSSDCLQCNYTGCESLQNSLCVFMFHIGLSYSVTTGYNLGISSPKSEEPHYDRKVRVKPIL